MPEFSAPPSEFEDSELMDVDSIEFLSSESEEDHDDGPSLLEEVESEPILGQGDDNSKAEISVSSPASDVESGTASTSSKMRAKSRQVVTSNSIFSVTIFVKNMYLIFFEGKSMTSPCQGNTILFRSSQQLPRRAF